MNKSFTQQTKIVLDEKYYIEPDGDNGIVLVFSEMRKRDKTVKENGKAIKTGEQEDYLYESRTYHTRIAQGLKYYVEKSLNSSTTLEEIIQKENKVLKIIEDLDRNFKQF
jgi:hypothetical protein